MRRTLLIMVMAIFVLPATGQINIGTMKDKANEVTNKVPKQNDVDKGLQQKDCEQDKERLQRILRVVANL